VLSGLSASHSYGGDAIVKAAGLDASRGTLCQKPFSSQRRELEGYSAKGSRVEALTQLPSVEMYAGRRKCGNYVARTARIEGQLKLMQVHGKLRCFYSQITASALSAASAPLNHPRSYQVTWITPANAPTLWPRYEATFGIPRGIPRGDVLSYHVVTQGPPPEVMYAHLHTPTIKHTRYLPGSLWFVSLSSSTNGFPLWCDATGIGSFF
jgi:hypothetical protein